MRDKTRVRMLLAAIAMVVLWLFFLVLFILKLKGETE